MIRIYVIAEGQTEETFVSAVLAPHLYNMEIYPTPILIGKPGHKGGILSYQRAKNDILMMLKQDQDAYCTTMFDYFRLPQNFPGMPVQIQTPVERKAKIVEEATYNDIHESLGENLRPDRFIPYIQMHEFEAILFSDPGAFSRGIFEPNLAEEFGEIRRQFNTPEEINENPTGAPSKRIIAIFPAYEKVIHGSLAAIEIGLETIRRECLNFNNWLTKIENLTRRNRSLF